jgi:hypothetical protein
LNLLFTVKARFHYEDIYDMTMTTKCSHIIIKFPTLIHA